MKPFVFDQACQFIKHRSDDMSALLTKSHRNVIRQFIEYKERSEQQLQEAEAKVQCIPLLEQLVAQKTPVMEAEYAIDDRSPLNLYNCLVPKLKELRRFKLGADEKFSIEDFRAQQAVLAMRMELEKEQLPKLQDEYRLVCARNAMLENELQIVKWYLHVVEDNVDTKEIVKEYGELSQEYKAYQKRTQAQIERLTNEKRRLTGKYQEAMKTLQRQQEKVVKPLISECAKREKEC